MLVYVPRLLGISMLVAWMRIDIKVPAYVDK